MLFDGVGEDGSDGADVEVGLANELSGGREVVVEAVEVVLANEERGGITNLPQDMLVFRHLNTLRLWLPQYRMGYHSLWLRLLR